jgi:murein DD-endopeptidase MepM/ murein hydrolase activator NlpD
VFRRFKIYNKEDKQQRGIADFLFLFAVAIFIAFIIYFIIDKVNINQQQDTPLSNEIDSIPPPTILYGIPVDSFKVIESKVKRDESLSEILKEYNITPQLVNQAVDSASGIFNLKKIKAGFKYALFISKGDTPTARYFIYEEDPISYIVVKFFDSLTIYRGVKEVDTFERQIAGEINTSLWVDMIESGASPSLITAFTDIFAWQIDFFNIAEGDKFKVIYEDISIDDNTISIGKIKGAYFQHEGENYYAIFYRQDETDDYFDERGSCLRKMFLKAPLKFSRISSTFTRRRFHPILKIYRPHLAIDYAAPRGTPVYTVGDGVVISAGYSGGAGNMVKIRHNGTYISAYNHLSRFAKNVRSGRKVRQGDVIGYVGTSGLSTGPHLDFRIWKNGSNVNPLSLKLPPAKSVSNENLPEFNKIRNKMVYELNKIPYSKN